MATGLAVINGSKPGSSRHIHRHNEMYGAKSTPRRQGVPKTMDAPESEPNRATVRAVNDENSLVGNIISVVVPGAVPPTAKGQDVAGTSYDPENVPRALSPQKYTMFHKFRLESASLRAYGAVMDLADENSFDTDVKGILGESEVENRSHADIDYRVESATTVRSHPRNRDSAVPA